jgi:hypothetical protein
LLFRTDSSHRSDHIVRVGTSPRQDISHRSDLAWCEAQAPKSLFAGRRECKLCRVSSSAYENLSPLCDERVHELVVDHTVRLDFDVVLDVPRLPVVHSGG